MKLKEFQELDGWVGPLDKFAKKASCVIDHPKLYCAAIELLAATEKFTGEMGKVGVEVG